MVVVDSDEYFQQHHQICLQTEHGGRITTNRLFKFTCIFQCAVCGRILVLFLDDVNWGVLHRRKCVIGVGVLGFGWPRFSVLILDIERVLFQEHN